MITLGINGGLNPVHANLVNLAEGQDHDSAAVLVEDGRLVVAIEEERLNRIKHTNKFPANAIRACLQTAGLGLGDVDQLAIYVSEMGLRMGQSHYAFSGRPLSRRLGLPPAADREPRALLQLLFERELGAPVKADRFCFVRHHLAHAVSAFVPSGFDRALVVTLDGQGEGQSGCVAQAGPEGIEVLRSIGVESSLGHLYWHVTALLGFEPFDEYKVMGLAPYGDPGTFRSLFRELLALKPDGEYELNRDGLARLAAGLPSRRPSEPPEQPHKDVAAALQETLEVVVFHLLDHYRRQTRLDSLCLAGGVAHNCTLNGKVLASGLFSRVFVQPASHDAGCALGAALYAGAPGRPKAGEGRRPRSNQYLGNDVGDARKVKTSLAAWEGLVSYRESDRPIAEAADLLADGNVIGWVQGRAEFGPRALGNRSILAHPGPAKNKDIINAMVKKREGFRPFAPAVQLERAAEYFEIPAAEADLGHMTFVLKVRSDKRPLLGAVTHVDGSARVQTVTREDNERFWSLIDAFAKVSGVPVLLNTSFNNNAEPIVDSVDDAVVCFLTTGLNKLVVGDFIVEKHPLTFERCRRLFPALCRHISVHRSTRVHPGGGLVREVELRNSYNEATVPLPVEVATLLEQASGGRTLAEIVDEQGLDGEAIFPLLLDLWARRLLLLLPQGQPRSGE